MQLKCKKGKICAVYGEGAGECVKSGLRSVMLEISCWMMLHGRADQLKLIAIKSKHWEQSMFYHVGVLPHTENIQIENVIVENEKCVFYFTETIRTFWATQYLLKIRHSTATKEKSSLHFCGLWSLLVDQWLKILLRYYMIQCGDGREVEIPTE